MLFLKKEHRYSTSPPPPFFITSSSFCFLWFSVFWNIFHIILLVNSSELSKVHNQELQTLDKTLKETEAALTVSFCHFHLWMSVSYGLINQYITFLSAFVSFCIYPQGQIEVLTEENKALIEKLTAEENRRKELAEKSPVLVFYVLIISELHIISLHNLSCCLPVSMRVMRKQIRQWWPSKTIPVLILFTRCLSGQFSSNQSSPHKTTVSGTDPVLAEALPLTLLGV